MQICTVSEQPTRPSSLYPPPQRPPASFDPARHGPGNPPPPPSSPPPPPPGWTPPWASPLPPPPVPVPAANGMATTSLVFGLCSLLVPLLSIPGVILGIVSLHRISRRPGLSGQGRSIAGIVTSATLGPLAVFALVLVLAANSNTATLSIPPPKWVPVHIDHPVPAAFAIPAALTAANTAPGAEVTPAQAKVIFGDLWTLRNEAFTTHNRSLMAAIESGPALEADEVTCSCNARAPRGPILHESVLVPKQSSLPATFLGEATTTFDKKPYVQYLVISRQSASQEWKVVADPGYTGTGVLDAPANSASGFDQPTAGSSVKASTALPAAVAAYWQTWTDTRHAPGATTFAPGRWTTQAGKTLAKSPEGAVYRQNGLNGYYLYRAGGPGETWTFRTAQGEVTCGVVRWQTYWTSKNGTYQQASLDNWGLSVSPGVYRAVVETDIIQPCFVQHPGQATAVISGQEDPDTLQGVGLLASIPSTTTTTAPSPYGTPPSGQLLTGDSAIVGISGSSVTVDTDGQDVRYTECPAFGLSSSTGVPLASSTLAVGDVGTVTAGGTSAPCLSRVALLATPQPPQCKTLNSGGQIDAVWVGANTAARSIVYARTGAGQPTVALRWCQPPTAAGANGSAIALSSIAPGSTVQISMSGNVWVTGITVLQQG